MGINCCKKRTLNKLWKCSSYNEFKVILLNTIDRYKKESILTTILDSNTLLHIYPYIEYYKLILNNISSSNIKKIINHKNKHGYTPLHICIKHSNYECVNILLKNGADPNIRDAMNNTPLNLSIFKCVEPRIPKLLMLYGASDTLY